MHYQLKNIIKASLLMLIAVALLSSCGSMDQHQLYGYHEKHPVAKKEYCINTSQGYRKVLFSVDSNNKRNSVKFANLSGEKHAQ